MTVAPASPRAAAMPRPAPRVAPATTATRPRRASGSGCHVAGAFISNPPASLYPSSPHAARPACHRRRLAAECPEWRPVARRPLRAAGQPAANLRGYRRRHVPGSEDVMIVEQIWTANSLRNFHYLIACPQTGEALAVDPLEWRMCLTAAERNGWEITQILNTHEHSDHTGGNAGL